jgi:hypothetical protein
MVITDDDIINTNNADNCISIPIPSGFIINDCINRNVISSMLFILPATYGYIIRWFLISVGSVICFFTSIINHYNTSQHRLFRPLDIVCVNSIAAYFVFFTIYNIGISFYSIITYLLCFITVSIYLYIFIKPYLYANYYCLVHLFAVTGIMFCIKSYDTHFNSKNKSSITNENRETENDTVESIIKNNNSNNSNVEKSLRNIA